MEDSLRVRGSFPSEKSRKSEELLVRTNLASFCGTDSLVMVSTAYLGLLIIVGVIHRFL
jgi:hypothetical protein